MTVMSRAQEGILQKLIEFAGDPVIVQDALRDLKADETAPTLEQVLFRILQLKRERGLLEEAAAG